MPDDSRLRADPVTATPDAFGADLALVFDAITVPTLVHRGGPILHANPAMQRLAGQSGEALRALPLEALAVEDERDGLRRYTDTCLSQTGEPPAMEVHLRNLDGVVRPVEINARRLMLDGQPTLVVSCQDLSDIQHVQNSMLTLSQLLHQIINGGPLATFVIDQERRVTHWNRACQQLTGWPAYKMIGSTESWRAFYPEQRPMLADLIAQGLGHEALLAQFDGPLQRSEHMDETYEGEAFVASLGQGGRWLYFNAAPLRDASGALIGAVQTMQDVTLRRQAEQELLRHRNQLEQLVAERSAELGKTVKQLAAFMENSPVGVLRMEAGKVTHHNRVAADMFGLRPDKVVGMKGSEFFISSANYRNLIERGVPMLSKGKPLQHEMWLKHSSGSPLWVQIIAYAADPANAEAGTWWLLQDRTEFRRTQDELHSNFERIKETNQKLEQAQNQLLQSDKMASVGQLAAGVAHEINNPIGFVGSNLHSLKGYVQDMMALIDAYQQAEAGGFGPEQRAELSKIKARVEMDYLREDVPQLLSESEDGLGRVKRIVQDLKDFSRVDQADWQDADLNAGLESTLNVVMHEVKYKAGVIRKLGQLPPVRCLAAQLNQVFMNLIVNASHAITGHGTITLASGQVDDWVWVEVGDTGCGMTPEVIKRVFEPFFTTKPVGKGTGLGLSLSFSIVQRHGGAIRIRSVPGQGSAFKVWVPVAGPAADGSVNSPPDDPPDLPLPHLS